MNGELRTIDNVAPALKANCDKALAQILAAKAELDIAEFDLRARTSRLAEAERQQSSLINHEKEDLVARILGGESSRPQKPKRRARIDNLKDEIEGLKLAIPTIRGRVEQAHKTVREASEAFASAILPTIFDRKAAVAAQLRDRLASLAPHLEELLALDLAQDELVGSFFTMTGRHEGAFSGRIVTESFIKQLGDRLRPDALNLGKIERAASAIASDFIQNLKGA